MHTLWKGSISFGLVNVPVKLHAATEAKEFQFHYLHNACQRRIRYAKKCPHCEVEVGPGDLVKGYEYERDHYVILTDEEMAVLEQPRTRSIDILDFVNLSDIDPVYYQKSYYLSPEDTAQKAYRLLSQAMLESGKVALARITLRSKQHLACLRVYEEGLVLETMYYPDEIRHLESTWNQVVPTEAELVMAKQLIESLGKPFEPEKYQDEVRAQLAEMIEKKVQGQTFVIESEPQQGKVLDLMQALRASLAMAEEKKGKPAGRNQAGSETVADAESEVSGVSDVSELSELNQANEVKGGEPGVQESFLKPKPRKRAARAKGA